MTLKRCQDCKTDYQDQDAKHFGHCPNCDSGFFTLVLEDAPPAASKKKLTEESRPGIPLNSTKSSSRSDQVAGVADIEKLIAVQQETTRSLIAAQNKTTHAVRAFVRFLFIQLSGFTAAGFVWYLSFLPEDGNLFLQILAIAIWLGSVIYSSSEGWAELKKSDVY